MTLKKKNFSPRNLIKALQSTLIFFFFKKPPSRTHTHVFLEGACGLSCSVVSDSLQLNGLESCCLVTRPFGLFETLWTAAHQVSLSFSISWSLLRLMLAESVMPSNHLILWHSFLLLPSSFVASGSFPLSQLFTTDGQSIGASASASLLPMNIQSLFPLGLTI